MSHLTFIVIMKLHCSCESCSVLKRQSSRSLGHVERVDRAKLAFFRTSHHDVFNQQQYEFEKSSFLPSFLTWYKRFQAQIVQLNSSVVECGSKYQDRLIDEVV